MVIEDGHAHIVGIIYTMTQVNHTKSIDNEINPSERESLYKDILFSRPQVYLSI